MAAEMRSISEDDEVRRVLREHPEIEAFIQRVAQASVGFYPGAEVVLDGAQFEDDPPLVLTVKAVRRMSDFPEATNRFARWLALQPDYDFELISVAPMPSWSRPAWEAESFW